MTVIELCVEDTEGVQIASQMGIDRVELCDDLSCGGLTPSDRVVDSALSVAPSGGMQVLIRPRPGTFVMPSGEERDIAEAMRRLRERTDHTDIPVGFVVGGLTSDHEIDQDVLSLWRDAAGERPLTFHRAFDTVQNMDRSLDQLIRAGFDRVLTTGGDASVVNMENIRHLTDRAAGEMIILVSGGLRSHNVASVIHRTGATEVHMRAPAQQLGRTDPDEAQRIVAVVRGQNL